jgi:hypothetical protein
MLRPFVDVIGDFEMKARRRCGLVMRAGADVVHSMLGVG